MYNQVTSTNLVKAKQKWEMNERMYEWMNQSINGRK